MHREFVCSILLRSRLDLLGLVKVACRLTSEFPLFATPSEARQGVIAYPAAGGRQAGLKGGEHVRGPSGLRLNLPCTRVQVVSGEMKVKSHTE